MLLFTCSS